MLMNEDELTSMNFFWLSPLFFDKVRTAFREFISDPWNIENSEIYLPILLGELADKGEITVKVIPTGSSWFGMTYKEDRPLVKREFRRLIDEGAYPSPLWEMD